MPDQAIVYMGVLVKTRADIPNVTPCAVQWRTPLGNVVSLVPELVLLEDGERETGLVEDYPSGRGTVYGFALNGRYFPEIIDKDGPEDIAYNCGDGDLLPLDLDQLVALRASVREWFPGAEVIVTTVFH